MTNSKLNKQNAEKIIKTSPDARFFSFTPKSKFSLSKKERLTSSKEIASVFANSLSISDYPILAFYKTIPQDQSQASAKAAFTVSKKKFKRAVDRNKIKRILKEAYRHQKFIFYEKQNNHNLLIVFVYISNKIEPSALIHKKMNRITKKLAQL